MRRQADIKAPDGFLLGGLRTVRRDGSILFQNGWWQAPIEWAGERVWVHSTDSGVGDLEVAPPGWELWAQGREARNIFAPRTKRPDSGTVRRTMTLSEARAEIARLNDLLDGAEKQIDRLLEIRERAAQLAANCGAGCQSTGLARRIRALPDNPPL